VLPGGGGGYEVHRASRAYQLESSDGAAGMQGVESAALGAETAEESAGTTGTVVAGTDTAATGHNLLTGLLDGTGLPAVR
jgi:2-succinyl-5-enolpyruvyl-6-hydroxy-3-cyclohexene-1-carboxylate synthase